MDEIGFSIKQCSGFISTRKGSRSPYSIDSGDQTHITIITTICATGYALDHYFLLKGKRLRSHFIENITLVWAQIWNQLYAKGKKCKAQHNNHPNNFITNKEHVLETLEGFDISNVILELHSFINPKKSINCDINNLYKIHNLLLSIV